MHFSDFIANGESGKDFLISFLHISALLKSVSTDSWLLPVGVVCVTSLPFPPPNLAVSMIPDGGIMSYPFGGFLP